MLYRIIALDPGGTTGWATYTAEKMHADGGGPDTAINDFEYYSEVFDRGQLGPDEHHNELDILLGMQQVQEYIVVCESFEFRNMDRRHRDNINLMSREYIGVAKRFCQERGVPIKLQTAAIAKGFIPDSGPMANKKIKDAGLWWPNHVHAMDATRHLLWYLVNRDNRMDLVRKWWKP